jgi:hypothetical protein
VYIYIRLHSHWDDGTRIPQNEHFAFTTIADEHFSRSGFTLNFAEINDQDPRDPAATRINYLALFLTTPAGQYINEHSVREDLSDMDRALLWERGLEKFKNENPQFHPTNL